MIKDQWAPNGLGAEFCTASVGLASGKGALDMGFNDFIRGHLTFPKAQQIRDAGVGVPLDRMLIETDAPYLAPVPHRGKRNEPAFVKETARKLGELRRCPWRKSANKLHAISTIFSKLLKSLKQSFRRVDPLVSGTLQGKIP